MLEGLEQSGLEVKKGCALIHELLCRGSGGIVPSGDFNLADDFE